MGAITISPKVKLFLKRYKVLAKLKVLVVLVAIVMFVTPLRNALVPGWPHLLRQLSTFKVIRVHLVDLFTYIDRTPYTGSCDFVHQKLATVKMPRLEDMPVYTEEDFDRYVAPLKPRLTKEQQKYINNYSPSLGPKDQRVMNYVFLTITQALAAFKVTYFISEGSLIGYWRHHGSIPWDDDQDLMFDVKDWLLVKKILSCLPGLQLNMGSDYMWKVYHKDSELWLGESAIKFPFIDVFPFQQDSEHVWPLTIWMKTEVFFPRKWVYPPAVGVFEGWNVSIPRDTVAALDLKYGHVSSDCYSRTFLRRERYLVPKPERIHFPCSLLSDIYPFVVRRQFNKEKGWVLEERISHNKVISTFNTSYQVNQGDLD